MIGFTGRLLVVAVFVIAATPTFAAARPNSPPGSAAAAPNAADAASSPGREHYQAARVFERAGLYQNALGEIDIALSANWKNPAYHNVRGYCLERLRRYDEAIQAFNHTLFFDPGNEYARRHLARCEASRNASQKPNDFGKSTEPLTAEAEGDQWLGLSRKQVAEDSSPKQKDFPALYANGIESYRAGKYEDAVRNLGKAVALKPKDFDANLWRGMALVRLGKLVEAIPNFETAHGIKQDDPMVKLELFGCYLVAQQVEKAFGIFPLIAGVIGGGLLLIYALAIGVLLMFTVPIRTAAFPGVRFSVAWTAVYWEGQVAFLFLFIFLLRLTIEESTFLGLSVAALPVIIVAATGFVRQPWGTPFRWPLRIGTWKVVGISLVLLVLLQLVAVGFAELYREVAHKPAPLQNVVPIIRGALKTSPVIAWTAIVVVTPLVEEILFRGLLYGAFEKRWGFRGAILGSSLLFAVFHLQLVGFLSLFGVGTILAWARYRTDSIGLPILLHGLNNGLAMAMLTFWRG